MYDLLTCYMFFFYNKQCLYIVLNVYFECCVRNHSILSGIFLAVPPHFVRQIEAAENVIGGTVHLQCEVTGTPEIKMSWFKAEVKIRAGEKHKMSMTDNIATLELRNLSKSDAGKYVCKAENSIGAVTCSTHISVKERKVPPSFIRKFKDLQETEGAVIKFDCRLSGSEPFHITWYRNGSEIFADIERCNMTFEDNIPLLKILNLRKSDAGEYTCKASNEVGTATCSAVLSVKGTCTYLVY
uniref:Ig-like domain-containing protein n=1 Tax=Eptatretus burgeri TaxID=7764 RepID=A0A8C4Q728_EPTBU